MSDVDWKDPKARMAHARSQRIVGRARVLPKSFIDTLGEAGVQPAPEAAQQMRPIETPNPMLAASEPFSFPPPQRMVEEYGDLDVRPVVEAEIEGLMEWGLPKYQEIYPRCTYDSIKPMLIMGCRGGRMRFLRTANAVGLFIAETTPWEPELYVWQVLVASRMQAPREVHRLLRAGKRWAEQIGAVGFEFGSAVRETTDRMRPDSQVVRYIKILRKPVVEPAEIAPGARMAAMGMVRETAE